MESNFIYPVSGDRSLRDESQFSGVAVSMSSPTSETEVAQIILACRKSGDAITVHGSLTGMNGAGVPNDTHAMCMGKMSAVQYHAATQTVWAQAGATFDAIEQTVRRESRMMREFPWGPSEKTATLGGGLSFCTSGLRCLGYGSVFDAVLELEYCDSFGCLHRIKREEEGFQTLLASEGMYAVFTGARLSTVPLFPCIWGLMFFFPSDAAAAAFADRAVCLPAITALEYLDRAGFLLVQEFQDSLSTVGKLPEMPAGQSAAIYIELEADQEAQIEQAAEQLIVYAEEDGGDPNATWTAVGDEVRAFRELFHSVTECANVKAARCHAADTRIKKLSCCVCLTNASRLGILKICRECLEDASFAFIISGHLGSCSLCVDLIAQNAAEYSEAQTKVKELYQRAVLYGVPVSWSRGVGKLYREIYCATAPLEEISRRIKAKQKYDPDRIFNPGNMFANTVMP